MVLSGQKHNKYTEKIGNNEKISTMVKKRKTILGKREGNITIVHIKISLLIR